MLPLACLVHLADVAGEEEGGALCRPRRARREAQRDAREAQREAPGAFIREQRKQANLPLRRPAEKTSLSSPYLSQIERGLHQSPVRVLKPISDAFNLSAETLPAQAGLINVTAGKRKRTPLRRPRQPFLAPGRPSVPAGAFQKARSRP